MVFHSLHRHSQGHGALLDWLLMLAGALFALLFWPPTPR
jgi:hypothetical protein